MTTVTKQSQINRITSVHSNNNNSTATTTMRMMPLVIMNRSSHLGGINKIWCFVIFTVFMINNLFQIGGIHFYGDLLQWLTVHDSSLWKLLISVSVLCLRWCDGFLVLYWSSDSVCLFWWSLQGVWQNPYICKYFRFKINFMIWWGY